MDKIMRKAQVGDKVIITNVGGGDYYSVGDIGVILRIDRDCCEVDFNNQGNKRVVDDGRWWVGYYSDDENKLELYKGFSSQQELWEYLISGGKVCKANDGNSFYSLINGKVHKTHADGVSTGWTSNFMNFTGYEKYIEPPKWYENIPEQGVLCWVDPKSGTLGRLIRLIGGYDPSYSNCFISKTCKGISWDNATPLTEEEVKQYIYKQN